MEFVAQKLGFLRCPQQNTPHLAQAPAKSQTSASLLDDTRNTNNRSFSQEEESSDSGSFSLGKLKITEPSESEEG